MISSQELKFDDLQLNAALGCVLGAFIGDSIGAIAEFKENVTEEEAKEALKMNGGGKPYNRAPGQITDDSEMALCLSNALLESGNILNLDKIAK